MRNVKSFLFPGIIVLIVGGSLVIIGKMHGNLERELLGKLIKSPVANSFKILDVDYKQAEKILRQNNIKVSDSLQSIEEISSKNKKSPEEIIELIIR